MNTYLKYCGLLILSGCTQSEYFGDYHESSTVTYGMAGNSIRQENSGYWHESGINTPQGDVAIWNDNVRIHINGNDPYRRQGYRNEPCYIERNVYHHGQPTTILQPCSTSPYR
ncbi:MAG: hypothetical protein Q4A74_01975 [Cardiobacteriaceae bacterium]|nr:hypothetical protein [Cardiobacteriaceae bacterium]